MTNEEVVDLRKVKQCQLPDDNCLNTQDSVTPVLPEYGISNDSSSYTSNANQCWNSSSRFVHTTKRKIGYGQEQDDSPIEENNEQPPKRKLKSALQDNSTIQACDNNGDVDAFFSTNLDSKYTVANATSESSDECFGDTFSGPEPEIPLVRHPWMTPYNTTQYIFSQHENDPVNDDDDIFGYEYLVSQYAALHGLD
ncbi:uncharacterized protein TRIADDRAFT_56671 [Trichoplax adhaerens]|uniref:Uncharacterized protein n=1 Tax=Trichoplax adhaerens TaxID=10228 RepID=B3RW96_TRIAD|nr:predicted protein [Trichoplax adhaerens]EDV25098.1 predicted protein [Trichoplax adhaerens]|eukprot:XP_002112988.1 predicted protein [Trichoplax adhaerens]